MRGSVWDALLRLARSTKINELQRDALLVAVHWHRRGERSVESLCACGQLYLIAYAHSPLVERARKYFEEALERDPECWLAMREIGALALTYFDQAEEAETWLRRSMQIHPALETTLYLAKAEAMQGRKEAAIQRIMWIHTPEVNYADYKDLEMFLADEAASEHDRALIAEARREIDEGLWDRACEEDENPV